MSVLSYLSNKASSAVLSGTEKISIGTSIATLQNRLGAYFDSSAITKQYQFGSSTRGTILPRAMDEHSDVDYMIVFSDNRYKPQTYLDWLKRFVSAKYSTSEKYQSHPTVVLELNHIKFELVPAVESWLGGLQIPSLSGEWQSTNPNDINQTLEDKNKANNSLIKPTIRLFKYWNASAGYPFGSFLAEKWITGLGFWFCSNQRDYLYSVFASLETNYGNAKWVNDEVTRAKAIIARSKEYEEKDMPIAAEAEIKKLFRE